MRYTTIMPRIAWLFFVVAGSACNGVEAPAPRLQAVERAEHALVAPVSRPLVSPELWSEMNCPTFRWVAQKTNPASPCPVPAGGSWSAAPLFGAEAQLPPALAAYCVYEYQGAGDAAVPGYELDRLHKLLSYGLAELEPDCLAPRGLRSETNDSALARILSPELHASFMTRTESLPLPPRASLAAAIDLRILDMAEPCDVDGSQQAACLAGGKPSSHAATLAKLVEDLLELQPRAADPVVVHPTFFKPVAMPRRVLQHLMTKVPPLFRPQYLDGLDKIDQASSSELHGILTVSQLAQALLVALQERQDAAVRLGSVPHMVVNMSLGWDNELRASMAEHTPSVEAFKTVLELASCMGILVIAASGNRIDFATTQGDLCPAEWEAESAPSLEDCRTLMGPWAAGNQWPNPDDFPIDSTNSGRPIVYSVSGVTPTGEMLANSRPGDRHWRLAYGDHVVTEAANGGNPSAVLTGSSVAAAVVSAAATAVWYYRPDLSADEVMGLLWEANHSASVPLPGGVSLPAAALPVSICASLTKACEGSPALCPPEGFSCTVRRSTVPPVLSAEVLSDPLFQDQMMRARVPAAEWQARAKDTASALAVATEMPGLFSLAWIEAQPPPDPCSACFMALTAIKSSSDVDGRKLTLFIDRPSAGFGTAGDSTAGATVVGSPVLILRTKDTERALLLKEYAFKLQRLDFELPADINAASLKSATLVFQVKVQIDGAESGPYMVQSPLYVYDAPLR